MRTEMASPASGDIQITLATLSGGGIAAPVYVCSDWTDVLSTDPPALGVITASHTYQYLAMAIDLPTEDDASPPSCHLVFENVAVDMVAATRAATGMIDVELRLVYAGDVNADIDPYLMKCEHASYDNNIIILDVARDDDSVEPASLIATKNRFPGLFP